MSKKKNLPQVRVLILSDILHRLLLSLLCPSSIIITTVPQGKNRSIVNDYLLLITLQNMCSGWTILGWGNTENPHLVKLETLKG